MHRVAFHISLIFATMVALVACGGPGAASKHASTQTHAPATRSTVADGTPIATDLRIVMQHVGGKDAQGVPAPSALTCDKSSPSTCLGRLVCPTSDDAHKGACDWVASNAERLTKPPPARQMCTQQYGGPQTAHVTGTVNGAHVDITFGRTDGCAIDAWEHVSPLWTA